MVFEQKIINLTNQTADFISGIILRMIPQRNHSQTVGKQLIKTQ